MKTSWNPSQTAYPLEDKLILRNVMETHPKSNHSIWLDWSLYTSHYIPSIYSSITIPTNITIYKLIKLHYDYVKKKVFFMKRFYVKNDTGPSVKKFESFCRKKSLQNSVTNFMVNMDNIKIYLCIVYSAVFPE